MRLFAQAFICITVALTVAVNQKDGDEGRPYEFGFTIDGQQHRHEKKDENGIIQGEFGFITADGVYHVTVYATDENGNFKILSMRNIRISAPLDGSPALGPISPEAGKYLGKLGQTAPAAPAAPQPVQKFERLQEQPKPPAITEPPKKFYDFTTKPTIKPACGGCGYVTTSKPFTLQYQNPAYQKPSVQVQGPNLTQNSIVSQQPQTQPAVQTGYNNNAGQKPTSQQNGFFNQQSQNLPVTPANQQQISVQQTAVQTGYNNNPSQQPTSEPNGFFNQPSQNLPTSQQQQISVQQPQLPTYNQNQNGFIGQQPQIFQTETPTYQTGFINQQPQVPSTVQIGVPQIPFSGQNNFIPSVPSVQPSGFSQGPGRLPVQPQGLLQTPPDVELLSPGSFPQTPGNNVQIQQQQPAFTPFGNQQSSFSKPNGIQTHGSLIQPFSPQTQNGYDPVDISQGPSALNSPPFVNTPSRQNQQEPTSKLPPITLSDNVIHVGGKKPQDIPIQDKFPGMADGLPDGVDDTDVKDILYKFKYIVGFHGHYEKGLKNGAKIGGYFVNGRDGISRVVTYVADEYGYRPKFKFINLGLDSPDTPKEGTEKTFGLKSFEFVWYPIE